MRIGIVCYPTFGGSGVVATELGLALAEKGHVVHFITYDRPVRLPHAQANVYFHEVRVSDYPLFDYQPYELVLSSKLVDVVKLVDLTEGAHIEREIMLIKVRASGAQRAEIKRCVDIFRGQIVDVTSAIYTIQLVGSSSKLDAFLEAVGDAAILEVVRSGVSGIARGEKVLGL